MNVPWSIELKEGQRPDPVVFSTYVALPEGFIYPTDEMLSTIFTTGSTQIRTWGRTPKTKAMDPHWIGLRGGTGLHTDPAYPRYSHHLKIRVDEGFSVQGLSKQPFPLTRGLFYILDAHSPHQVLCKGPDKLGFNIAISMDAKFPLEVRHAVDRLIEYGTQADFLKL